MRNIQIQDEQDVLGSMLVNGNMTEALLKDLTPNDFVLENHGIIYRAMNNLQIFGRFNAQDLLGDEHIARGKDILHLMNDCIMSNISIKCEGIHARSIIRNT